MERIPNVAANPPIVEATLIVESPAPMAPVAVVSSGLVENASTGEYRVEGASKAVGKLDIELPRIRLEAIQRTARHDPDWLGDHRLEGARGVGLEVLRAGHLHLAGDIQGDRAGVQAELIEGPVAEGVELQREPRPVRLRHGRVRWAVQTAEEHALRRRSPERGA